jgi:hypothetical protein
MNHVLSTTMRQTRVMQQCPAVKLQAVQVPLHQQTSPHSGSSAGCFTAQSLDSILVINRHRRYIEPDEQRILSQLHIIEWVEKLDSGHLVQEAEVHRNACSLLHGVSFLVHVYTYCSVQIQQIVSDSTLLWKLLRL